MAVNQRTLDEVMRIGMEALLEALGPADTILFLQRVNLHRGDYTEERQKWIGKSDVDTLVEEIRMWREAKKAPEADVR